MSDTADKLQLKILEIAEKPTEEGDDIVIRVERLHQALDGCAENLIALLPIFRSIVDSGDEMMLSSGKIGSPLCDGCAVFKVCSRKGASVTRCNDYQQKVDECAGCAFWDSVSCVQVPKCREGDRFEVPEG